MTATNKLLAIVAIRENKGLTAIRSYGAIAMTEEV
jgi:hypothetical protein